MMNYSGLFRLLEKKNIRRTELVRNGLLSSATMMRLRRNQSVSLHTLDRLSLYLGCSIFELMSSD